MSKFNLVKVAMEEMELEIDKAIEKQQTQEPDTSAALLSELTDPPVVAVEPPEGTEDTTEEQDPEAGTETPPEGETLPMEDAGDDASKEPKTEEEAKPAEPKAVLPETEDQKDAAEATAATESILLMIERGVKACVSLEKIADIIESGHETGGVSPGAARMTKLAVESICNDLGLSEHNTSIISVESFHSASGRLSASMEAVEDIKKKLEYIWQLIMNGLRSMMQFIRNAIIAYKSDMGKQAQELENLKEIYRNIKQVTPSETEIPGVLYQVLINNTSTDAKSSEVLRLGKITLGILDSYIVSFRRNLSTTLDAFESISMEMMTPGNTFKEDNLKAFGKIFGVHQSPVFEKKPSINGFKKNTDTVSCFETELMAGNMKLVSFTATEGNLAAADILDSKCLLVAVDRVFDGVDMEPCEERDFKKLFELIEEGIRLSTKSYEVADSVEKSIDKIMKVTKALSGKFVSGYVENGPNPADSKRQAHIYNQLSVAVQSFYTKPIAAVLRYNNRYVKALNAYGLASLKLYK